MQTTRTSQRQWILLVLFILRITKQRITKRRTWVPVSIRTIWTNSCRLLLCRTNILKRREESNLRWMLRTERSSSIPTKIMKRSMMQHSISRTTNFWRIFAFQGSRNGIRRWQKKNSISLRTKHSWSGERRLRKSRKNTIPSISLLMKKTLKFGNNFGESWRDQILLYKSSMDVILSSSGIIHSFKDVFLKLSLQFLFFGFQFCFFATALHCLTHSYWNQSRFSSFVIILWKRATL